MGGLSHGQRLILAAVLSVGITASIFCSGAPAAFAQPNGSNGCAFVVSKANGVYQAKDCQTGAITYNNTDPGQVIDSAVFSAMLSGGGMVKIDFHKIFVAANSTTNTDNDSGSAPPPLPPPPVPSPQPQPQPQTNSGTHIWFIGGPSSLAFLQGKVSPGDIVAAGLWDSPSLIQQVGQSFSNNTLMYIGNSQATVQGLVPTLKGSGYTIIAYDYESGGPDWTGNYQPVLAAASMIHKAGFLFDADTPHPENINGYIMNVAPVADFMSIQGYSTQADPQAYAKFYSTDQAAIRAVNPQIGWVAPSVGGAYPVQASLAAYNAIFPNLQGNNDRVTIEYNEASFGDLQTFFNGMPG